MNPIVKFFEPAAGLGQDSQSDTTTKIIWVGAAISITIGIVLGIREYRESQKVSKMEWCRERRRQDPGYKC